MIRLTRLNNHSFMLNSDLIKFVESSPDTVITLVSGEKILVRESVDQVLRHVVEFRLAIAPACGPQWKLASQAASERVPEE